LHQLLDSSANMASNEIRHRAQLVKNYGPVPPVHANEARLGQVFVNLLVNAAQAIPEGRAAHNEVRITTFTADDGAAVVEVRDTGTGIPENAIEHIFDPFFTTKAAGIGTGLGLAICRTTVESLGGTIHVENLPKRGVAFRICLAPYVGGSVVPTSNRSAVPLGRRGRILVVDDEALIANGLARVLGSEHDVTCLTSSREALARVEAGERFDVLLCDLMMPELSGMDLHDAVRALDSEQASRFVFLTGGAFTDRARAFLDRSTNPCVEKPYDAMSLRAMIRTLVT
jgi:CheY-like chemotaxis protein